MYRINKGYIVQKLDNRMVIFDGEKSILYTFNPTASYIFKHMKAGLSEREITDKLMRRYSIKEETAKKDFNKLVSDLRKKKIISIEKPKKQNK